MFLTKQTSLFTDFGISQQIIDEALCCGFNDKNSRVQIAMHFRRDRGVEYNARMLKFLYGTNGAGFVFNGEKVSFWYDENGIINAESLKKVQPKDLTASEIDVRLPQLLLLLLKVIKSRKKMILPTIMIMI